ncbi:DNA-binding transcriptional regulator [Neisseria sp. ZJ106]|uniref:DNA-binding transcriptional regulator n=1 Tax=Neisseria lisongii TaxID=2912188 RepID=A0AAW5AK25_9NEIS|nr:DNA-binding transcriptional regulator [Neisseria lisongii]MCF7521431.1 DNA-binding transcriptional regulator [Neisseria lisongii]MCF7528816.1 DNA-binding transcriptional regulator [Neisseria lisongii]WCL72318.1 DNA-binding transcriptional regulator [Neisseria lisongii]
MKYKSEVSEVLHDLAAGLHQIGVISDSEMKRYDKAHLTQVEPLAPADIKAIREREELTQAAFAIHLNISKNQVSDWERGVKKPSGTALKLLTLVKNKGIEAIA